MGSSDHAARSLRHLHVFGVATGAPVSPPRFLAPLNNQLLRWVRFRRLETGASLPPARQVGYCMEMYRAASFVDDAPLVR